MSYDDFLWDILERLHLADFFDEHNIPPILFLVVLVLLAILIIWLAYGFGGGVEEPETGVCGDGICQTNLGENSATCPEDCKPPETLKTVLVDILDAVRSNIDIIAEDSEGNILYSSSGTGNKFKITDITADSVKVTVRNPLNGMTVSSDYVKLEEETTNIPIGLPPQFFDVESVVPPEKATLRIVLKNKETGDPISGKVSAVIPNGISYVLAEAKNIDGTGYFTLNADQDYALIVDSQGYRQYNTLSSPIRLSARMEEEIIIELEPLSSDIPSDTSATVSEEATLRVCIHNQTGGPVPGSVEVYTATNVRLVTREVSSDGCATFELTPGDLVFLSTTNLPEECLDALSAPVQILPEGNEFTLNVQCGGAYGRVRMKILGENDEILTSEATITAWYASGQQISGSGYGHSLLTPPGSEYTEYVEVAASTPFNFMVTGLEGYATYRSQNYMAEPFEDRSIELQLTRESLSEDTIRFLGVVYPNPTFPNQIFTVTIPTVMSGNSDITNLADVGVSLAGTDCHVTKSQFWIARCTAPSQPGSYDLIISASYGGKYNTDIRELTVLGRGTGLFTLELIGLPDTTPPTTLEFNITLNGTPLDSLTDSNVTIFYVPGDIMVADQLSLSGDNGFYTLTADSQFSGEHRAEIHLMKIKHGKVYEQNFTITFMLSAAPSAMAVQELIEPRILEPREAFTVDVRIQGVEADVPNLDNVYFVVKNQRTNLPWNQRLHTYHRDLNAPGDEGIYPVVTELGDVPLTGDKKIYVVDTTKPKFPTCEITGCETIPDVRSCVYEYRYGGQHNEEEVIVCIESGWTSEGLYLPHCILPSANRGDWNENCRLDAEGPDSDVTLMEEFLRKIPHQAERNTYRGCGDMDNDGDVDEDDLKCLRNVASLKWFGDVGDGTCSKPMRGGFCFDIGAEIPGDYNSNINFDEGDLEIMSRIIHTIES